MIDHIGSRALGLVPVVAALFLGALMLPRSAVPDGVPVPVADGRALDRIAARDRELAAQAKTTPLSGDVRALGSALRDFNTKQAQDADEKSLTAAREALDRAIAGAHASGIEELLRLRAVQVEAFVAEVRRFEATGKESEELAALAGSFVRRLRFAGWCDEKNRIVLDDSQRRAAFKATWNALAGVEGRAEAVLSLDEWRALYTLYLQHPHAPEQVRDQIASARRLATDARTCAELAAREEQAAEGWRLDKVKKLGQIDAAYPLDYALGVIHYRRAEFPAAAESFRTWLGRHPDGPFALRARNYLKASIEAASF